MYSAVDQRYTSSGVVLGSGVAEVGLEGFSGQFRDVVLVLIPHHGLEYWCSVGADLAPLEYWCSVGAHLAPLKYWCGVGAHPAALEYWCSVGAHLAPLEYWCTLKNFFGSN